MSSISTTTEKKEDSSINQKFREHVKIIEEKSGIKGKYIITGLSICASLVFIGIFESFITNIVGIILPAYLSMKAIETYETDNEKQWITYWVLFAFYSILDTFSVFFLNYIPFYFFIKVIVLIWLYLPNFQGASYLYDILIFNLFKKVEFFVEKYISNKKRISDPSIDLDPLKQSKIEINQPNSPNIKSSNENVSVIEKKNS